MSDKLYVDDSQIETSVETFRSLAGTFEGEVNAAKAGIESVSWEDAQGQALADKAKATFDTELPKIVDSLHKCSSLCDSILAESKEVQSHIAKNAATLG